MRPTNFDTNLCIHIHIQKRLPPVPHVFVFRFSGLQVANEEDEQSPPVGSLKVQVMKHQRLALGWMLKREGVTGSLGPPRGGILADDQGLGKTVSTLALIVTNRRQRKPRGEEDQMMKRWRPEQRRESRLSSLILTDVSCVVLCWCSFFV